MKLWIRYLLGTLLGVVTGFFLSVEGGDALIVLQSLTAILIRGGRFLLFPLAFFAIIIAVDELRDDKRVLSVTLRTASASLATVLITLAVGVGAVILLQPQRIPPMIQESVLAQPPAFLEILGAFIPANGFRAFVLGEDALATVLLAGILIGWALRYDREITSPLSLVTDSANRILYHLNVLLTNVLGFFLAIPAGMIVVQLRMTADLALFAQFLLVAATAVLFIGIVVYPALLYLFRRDSAAMMRWVRSMTAPGFAALTSGDIYFATVTLVRTEKDHLGIPRRIGGSSSYLLAVFSRAGSAMIAVVAFLMVIRSYTALEIGVGEILQLLVTAGGASFLLGRTPAGAVTLLLSYLSISYGSGMEESFLILLPVLPILERLGAWLDIMTHGFIAYWITETEGLTVAPRPVQVRR